MGSDKMNKLSLFLFFLLPADDFKDEADRQSAIFIRVIKQNHCFIKLFSYSIKFCVKLFFFI